MRPAVLPRDGFRIRAPVPGRIRIIFYHITFYFSRRFIYAEIKEKTDPARGSVLLLSVLLQKQMLGNQNPDKVYPADNDAQERYHYTYDKSDDSALFEKGGPPDDYLRNPVYHGNEQ